MILHFKTVFWILAILVLIPISAHYPIDGYEVTGIERLYWLQRVMNGEIDAQKPPVGAQKSIDAIQLHLLGERGEKLNTLPVPDPDLQKALNSLFSQMDRNYSIALLDITPGREIRYAKRDEMRGYQPGSVGKIPVLAALFHQLKNIYPNSFQARQELLKNKEVRGGVWVLNDSHTVPIYNVETNEFSRRTIRPDDVFSLYEWADHMLSASNNGAASVVWREAILMSVFGKEYPQITEAQAENYFSTTSRSELSSIAMKLVNDPLRELDISDGEWRLGKLFTSGATNIIPASGGSIGSPFGLMKFLVAMERGKIIDERSSLEMKRLLYLTDRRIRYAASPALTEAAVYFKSGSLYKCESEEGFECKRYMGNVYNFMNSVAIIEKPNGAVYMVTLMSNVLRKNSSSDHYELATKIDRLITP